MAVDSLRRDRFDKHGSSVSLFEGCARCSGSRSRGTRFGAGLGADPARGVTIVVKTSHFGSNRSYGLAKAILLYSDGQEPSAPCHEPKTSPEGGPPYLDAGEPLTVDFLRQLAKGLGQTVAREILPANVLVRTPDMMVWWT